MSLEDREFSNSTAKLKSAEHSDNPIGDRLMCEVHVFYYNRNTHLILSGELMEAEALKIATILDGDS
jgi:hypothetical protein